MLVLKDVSLFLGGRMILDEVNWQLKPQDRVALIGGNGTGKTTLMKVIAGLIAPDSGEIAHPRDSTFGYLPQDGLTFQGRSLFQEAVSVFEETLSLEKKIKDLEGQLETLQETSPEYATVMQRYDRMTEEFRQRGGYRLEAEVGKVLAGLGFRQSDWEKSCEAFSGGWQMRIALAKLLLKRPDWLMLDEPTNHLDLDARSWLESYLIDYPSALLLVSHDRHFLDRVVKRCSELYLGHLADYDGNFSYYEEERERRYEALEEAARRQEEEIAKLERFVERFRAKATKATQAQSKAKQLEKIERIQLPPRPSKTVSFRFPPPPRSGKNVIELSNVSKFYGENHVLDRVELVVERGEKLAIVGANGAGKSTLIRILGGTESFEGGRQEGYQVHLSYFAQDQAKTLHSDHTVLQSIEDAAPMEMMPQIRGLLGSFLFQGDDVYKKVAVLSGGEKSRLALARMLLRPANLLLLDEPTNHLDMTSQDVLLRSLQSYEGTVVFVSHDRFFINQLATRIAEVDQKKLTSYQGNYEEYIREKQRLGLALLATDGIRWSTEADKGQIQLAALAATANGGKLTAGASPKFEPEKEQKQQKYYEDQQKKRERERKQRVLQGQITEVEKKLALWEERQGEIEEKMGVAGFYDDFAKASPLLEEYESLKGRIAQGYQEWEKLGQQLEAEQGEDEGRVAG